MSHSRIRKHCMTDRNFILFNGTQTFDEAVNFVIGNCKCNWKCIRANHEIGTILFERPCAAQEMREKMFVRRTRRTKNRSSNRQYLICINTFLFNNNIYVDKAAAVAYLSVSPHLYDNVEPKRQQPDREYRTEWNHFAHQVSNMQPVTSSMLRDVVLK